jgi:hypothetical protein
VIEIITNKLMDARAPTIVIDTWDAIGYSDKEALTSNIRVLDTWCRRASAKLIILSEQADDTTVDSLADGVVVLMQQRYNDRIMREIELSKLSGVQTKRPSYLFTLENSVFRSYGPHRPSDFVVAPSLMDQGRKVKRPGIRRSAPFIPTGHRELDSLLGGGFPRRGIVNIELDADVNPKVAVVLLSDAIRSFAETNNSVLFLPFEGLDQAYVDNHLRINSTGSSHRELVRTDVNRDAKMPRLVTVEQAGTSMERRLASFQEILLKMRKDHPGKLVLDIVGSNIVHGPKERLGDNVESLASFLRSSADLSVIVSRRSDDPSHIAGVSDIHLKIIDVKGTLFLQPQKPWANLYAITIAKRLGRASMRLDAIV